MKHSHSLICAAALFAAAALTTRAQVVNTLLDLGPNTGPYDVMVDPFNSATGLFLAARGGTEVGTIMRVDLAQAPVSTTVVDQSPGRIDQLGFDSQSGALFAVGSVLQGSERLWQVRRSLDQGATWSAAGANYQYKSGAAAFGLGFAADGAGKVFACGYAYNRSGGNALWTVRKSSDQGANWSTYAIGKGPEDVAFAIHFVPDFGPANHGGLFAVGRYNSLWTVQRSRDGGNTWTTIDSWSAVRNGTSVARTITSDAQGNVYVAGHSLLKDGNKTFVRMSANGGDTWQPILENFGTAPATPVLSYYLDTYLINRMTCDASGNLWTTGTTGSGTASSTWTMSRWNAGFGWSSLLPYAPASAGRKLTTDTAGNVYSLGSVQDSAGAWHCVLMQTSN